MSLRLAQVSLLVRDYDEAITFFTRSLGFTLCEDTPLAAGKRWVVVAPPGVRFVEEPRDEPYGRVAVFLDLYGNRWDLVEDRP